MFQKELKKKEILSINLIVKEEEKVSGVNEEIIKLSLDGNTKTETYEGSVVSGNAIITKAKSLFDSYRFGVVIKGNDGSNVYVNVTANIKTNEEYKLMEDDIYDSLGYYPCDEDKFLSSSDKLTEVFAKDAKSYLEVKGNEYVLHVYVIEGKKQAVNPYLPHFEYVPDGEPYVFDGRVYVYGSHDIYNGAVFCMGDYVCYSAPIDDLGNWRYEGVIYKKTKDPANTDGTMCLYAPDITIGPDGKYYLYYVLDHLPIVSVAVCDTPAGEFEFHGYVHYADGTKLGEKEGDEPSFDPGVITEGDKTYLYLGFCGPGDNSRTGSFVSVLDKDMVTIIENPKLVAPGCMNKTFAPDFNEHPFFEAPSIRKRNGKYYFVYSSAAMHELCYAMSDSPVGPFTYGGVIVSNCDLGIDTYKDGKTPVAPGANNHGSIIEIGDEWYIFYHRHTNNTWYCRQGCAEKISFNEDGTINQVEITSCGLNGGPLVGKGKYPAYIACHVYKKDMGVYIGQSEVPFIKQDGADGDKRLSFVHNVTENSGIGFKYFEFNGVKKVRVFARGYGMGFIEIRTSMDGEVLGKAQVHHTNHWQVYDIDASIPDGVSPLYITYSGGGSIEIQEFELV